MFCNIYCCYHDPKLLLDYGVKEENNDYFKLNLFYTKEENINKKSLNNLQNYFGEYVNQYYVWANNIKNDCVGFCQYGKRFNKTFLYNYTYFYDKHSSKLENLLNIIDDTKCIGITSNLIEFENSKIFINYLTDPCKHFDILFNMFENFVKDKYNHLYDNFQKSKQTDDMVNFIRFNCYICTWNTFDLYNKFVYDFFDYIGLNFDTIYKDKIEQWYIDNDLNFENKHWWFDRDRYFAYFIEYILSLYMYITNKEIYYTHDILT
jgi:hypothetical protein